GPAPGGLGTSDAPLPAPLAPPIQGPTLAQRLARFASVLMPAWTFTVSGEGGDPAKPDASPQFGGTSRTCTLPTVRRPPIYTSAPLRRRKRFPCEPGMLASSLDPEAP